MSSPGSGKTALLEATIDFLTHEQKNTHSAEQLSVGVIEGDLDIVFIENVGNMVCPASFDLGHHLNVTLLSVTEGDDKPAKYPVMFRGSNLTLLTKSDLLSVLDDFDVNKAKKNIRNLANPSPVFQISA